MHAGKDTVCAQMHDLQNSICCAVQAAATEKGMALVPFGLKSSGAQAHPLSNV